MNKVLLVGRLAANPENSTFGPENKKRSRFTVAVKDGWKKEGAAETSQFIPCVAWNASANFVSGFVKKGDLVSLDGRIVHRSYKDKEERTVYVTEVVVENINKLANAGGSSSALPGNENYGQNTSPSVSLQNKQTIASTNFDYSSGGNVESSSAQDDANDEIVPFDGESDKN